MFGRIPQYDPQNEKYPMRLALAEAPPEEPAKWPTWAMFNKPLNQGQTGTCVGHGGKHWMLIAPTIQTKVDKHPTAIDLYVEACKRDPWSENDNGDLQFGTSVLALFKAMKDMGLVGTYVHTNSVDEIRLYLKSKGPVIIGVPWYSSMMQVDKEGFARILPNAVIEGGHCICLKHWNKRLDVPEFPNSWGRDFGLPDPKTGLRNGYGRLDPGDLQRLLNEDGECITGLEQKLKPV